MLLYIIDIVYSVSVGKLDVSVGKQLAAKTSGRGLIPRTQLVAGKKRLMQIAL